MTNIPERDWRVFRDLRAIALERFCERVLREISNVTTSTGKTWHERYGDVFELLEREDAELARAFNGPSRSRAMLQLAAIHARGLLTAEELDRFTPETRERLGILVSPVEPRVTGEDAPDRNPGGRPTRTRKST